MMDTEALNELAEELLSEKDPDYKDSWERGYDAGMQHAGERLKKLLAAR